MCARDAARRARIPPQVIQIFFADLIGVGILAALFVLFSKERIKWTSFHDEDEDGMHEAFEKAHGVGSKVGNV